MTPHNPPHPGKILKERLPRKLKKRLKSLVNWRGPIRIKMYHLDYTPLYQESLKQ